MTIFIDDSVFTSKSDSPSSFADMFGQVMNDLIPRSRAIGKCELDGVEIVSPDQADSLFVKCNVCKVSSISLHEAVEAALHNQSLELRAIEQKCMDLVTDVLLAEPKEIVRKWSALCIQIKSFVNFLPGVSGLLTPEELAQVSGKELDTLNGVMLSLGKSFNAADTVKVSDLLELELTPWLKKMGELLDRCIGRLNALKK